MASKLKVHIDREGCISCGTCWDTCPEFFEQNPDDTHNQVVGAYRIGGDVARGEVPESLEELVKRAAESCPVEVIHIE